MALDQLISKAIKETPLSKRQKNLDVRVEGSSLIHMGLNENPYGMCPKSQEAIKASLSSAKFYPDFTASDLKKVISEYYGLSTDAILTGSGSSSMIDMLGVTFLDEGDEVLFCAPTFGAFVDMAYLNGAIPVTVPVTADQKFDLDGLLKAITDKTKMIVICNPNNPTGTYLSYDELKAFMDAVPKTVLIVMDEAYIEFATEPDCKSMVDYLKENPEFPMVIIRTFSKYYAMAGMRVGYAMAPEELITAMRKCSAAWNLNVFAQKAAIEAMKDQNFYQKGKALVAKGRDYITAELRKLGCKVFDSQSNFIYFDSGKNPLDLKQEMMEKGIHIGAFEYSRVSIGTLEECSLFVEKMKEVMA